VIPCQSNKHLRVGINRLSAGVLAALSLFAACIGIPAEAQTTPAQLPLVNRSASPKPNILFMLDDSISMYYSCVYLPHVVQSFARQGIPPELYPSIGTNYSGDCLTTYRQTSPANNALMYDPGKR
jgi:hypothetical protein